MPNKFTSTHPDTGQVAKRTSKSRTYTHAIWVHTPAEKLREQFQRAIECSQRDIAHYEAVVNGTEEPRSGESVETCRRGLEIRQQDLANVQKSLAEVPDDGRWSVFSWVGRPDLIDARHNEAAKYYHHVLTVEAVQV